jgi:hypothetical protein
MERPHAAVKIGVWGMLLLAILMLYIFEGAAHAQIPREAESYRREYTRIIRSEWGLDAPVSTLAAQIAQESMFNCRAVSPPHGLVTSTTVCVVGTSTHRLGVFVLRVCT